VRPETLDRVENGGSGSDNQSTRAKTKGGHTRQPSAVSDHDHPACSKPSRRGLQTAERAAKSERRAAVTASARAGVGNLRSGQKKACRAVEQKKGLKQENKKNKKESACIYCGD
jgi:hypothetical protein